MLNASGSRSRKKCKQVEIRERSRSREFKSDKTENYGEQKKRAIPDNEEEKSQVKDYKVAEDKLFQNIVMQQRVDGSWSDVSLIA